MELGLGQGLEPHQAGFLFRRHLHPVLVGFSSVEIGYLLLWSACEDVEEEADHLDLLWILWVPLKVGLLELVMGQAVEVVNTSFWTIVKGYHLCPHTEDHSACCLSALRRSALPLRINLLK